MKIIKVIIFSLLFILLSSPLFAGTTISYNRSTAIIYARDYCKTYNTDATKDIAYVKFEGRDCANFMSQALIAGGFNFSCVKKATAIGIGKKNQGEKGEITVAQLKSALKDSFCFEEITDKIKIKDKVQPGDILSWKSYIFDTI